MQFILSNYICISSDIFKVIVPVSLLKKKLSFVFALKVNIYLENMCAPCFPASLIMHVPISGTTCAIALKHEIELSTLPSIPSNCHAYVDY